MIFNFLFCLKELSPSSYVIRNTILGRCCSTFVLKHYWWENGEAEIEWRGIIINMWLCLNVKNSHRCRQSSPALRLWSCWPGCPGGCGAAPPGSGSEAGAAWAEQPLLQAAVFPPDFHPDLQMTHDKKVIVYGCECDVKCLISAEFKSCWSAARWHQCNYTMHVIERMRYPTENVYFLCCFFNHV